MSSDYKFLPQAGGDGDVVGPASSTDNAIAVFDGTTGKLLESSSATVISGNIKGASFETVNGLLISSNNSIRAGGVGPGINLAGEANWGISVDNGAPGQAYTQSVFRVMSNLAANVVQIIQGFASQSGDLLQFRNSAGTVLSSVNAAGQLSFETAETTFWATSVPATQQEAIERLAKAVSNDGASPIPEL